MTIRYPLLTVDLARLRQNARTLIAWCRARGVEVTAVTKLVASHPTVVRALFEGGVASFADSHLGNLEKIRRLSLPVETMLLRPPMAWECARAPLAADICCASDVSTLQLLSRHAAKAGRSVKVVVMVEMGNLREGVLPCDAPAVCREVAALPNLRLHGIGTIFGCLSGVAPARGDLEKLAALRRNLEEELGQPLPLLSGGSGSNIQMLIDEGFPEGVNHLRMGEAFFMGVEALGRRPIPFLSQDVFRFHAQVLEVRVKPSASSGDMAMDAFGRYTAFDDRGLRRRALVATGRQEVVPEDLVCLDPRLTIAGATGDQMVVDVDGCSPDEYLPGSIIAFQPAYGAVLYAFNSPYVRKAFSRA